MSSPLRSENYPDWYVENCPPADALNVEGTIYRFVESFPTIANDFLSYHEMGQRPNGKPCERCGLSVFHSIDDIRNSLRHLLKGSYWIPGWSRIPLRYKILVTGFIPHKRSILGQGRLDV